MSTLTHRKVNEEPSGENKAEIIAQATVSEEEMEPLPSCPSGEGIAQDNGNEVLNEALKDLNPRWRNWFIRGFYTLLMLGGFIFMVYLGK